MGGNALDICWAERGSPRLFGLKDMQALGMGWISENNFYDQRKLTDASDVFREVTRDHRYIYIYLPLRSAATVSKTRRGYRFVVCHAVYRCGARFNPD